MKGFRVVCRVSAWMLAGSTVMALEVGDPAPPLRVQKWVRGEPVELAGGQGKNILVVEFWATWCGPCRASIPHLAELQRRFAKGGVVFIGVTREGIPIVEAFVQDHKEIDYSVAVDDGGKTHELWMKGVDGIPHAFVVDRHSKIAWQGHPMGGLDQALEKLVGQLNRLGGESTAGSTRPEAPKTTPSQVEKRNNDEVFGEMMAKAKALFGAMPHLTQGKEAALRDALEAAETALALRPGSNDALALRGVIKACLDDVQRPDNQSVLKKESKDATEKVRTVLLGLLSNGQYAEAERQAAGLTKSAEGARMKAHMEDVYGAAINHGFKRRTWVDENEEMGGRRWVYTNCNDMKFVLVPAMPIPGAQSFYMGATEVTNAQYRRFSSYHDSGRTAGGASLNGDDQPVVRVSFADAMHFCEWLTATQKKALYAKNLPTPWVYRLPTSEEWEHACRAGNDPTWPYYYGNDWGRLRDYAWYDENSSGSTSAVGRKLPNRWGLYDMLGNAWEWCCTPCPGAPDARVIRGGSWGCHGGFCKIGFINAEFPSYHPLSKDEYKGFRVVRVHSPESGVALNSQR